MELQTERDLLKDAYGNYYLISNKSGKKLTIINAALYYSFNEMLDHELISKVQAKYPNKVACGKYFADLVEEHVEMLEQEGGKIYPIEEVKEQYDLHIKPIYGDSFTL